MSTFGIYMEDERAQLAALSEDENAVKEWDTGSTHARTATEIKTGVIARRYYKDTWRVEHTEEGYTPRTPVSGSTYMSKSELARLEKEEEMEERRAARK